MMLRGRRVKKRKFKLPRISASPFVRISLGLVSVTICMVLVGDIVVGLTSDERKAVLDQRKKICETLAVQFSELAEGGEVEVIRQSMIDLVESNADVLSTALRDAEGEMIASAGDHEMYWDQPPGDTSTPSHAQVPIFSGEEEWGMVQVSFAKLGPLGLAALLADPLVRFLVFMAAVGFLAYNYFMKKSLKHLDPKAVIPDRVRSALDLLAEGVVMVDQKSDIVLANKGFAGKIGKDPADLLGKSLTKMKWLSSDSKKSMKDKELPWLQAMKDSDTKTEYTIGIKTDAGEKRIFSVSSSPIMDANLNVRGAMVTFNDETALQQANSVLVDMMDKLKQSQEKATLQHEELKRLATQDPLTDCLNRRSFFEVASKAFAEAESSGGELSCIMTDIDRFKSINDQYGHAVGDQVIEQAAATLRSTFREQDFICRYGGEEFCIFLPGVDLGEAVKLAERARDEFEKSVGAAMRVKPKPEVTASFGVSALTYGPKTFTELIYQADKALYLAKQSGRNCVTRWDQVQDDMAA